MNEPSSSDGLLLCSQWLYLNNFSGQWFQVSLELTAKWADVFPEWGETGGSQVVSEHLGVIQKTGTACAQL